MKWKDKYRFVKQNMKKNKSRLFMTILATAMGCCFLVVLASIGFGFQQSLTEQITSYGKITEISIYGKTNQAESANYASSLYSKEQVAFFESLPHVEAVVRQNDVNLTSKYAVGDYAFEIDRSPVFTFMETEKNGKLELSEGRFPENEHEVIVGYNFAEFLLMPSKPEQPYQGSLLNQKIDITLLQPVNANQKAAQQSVQLHATVVGVLKQPPKEWLKDKTVVMDEKALQSFVPILSEEDKLLSDRYQNVLVYADDMQNVSGIADKIREAGYNVYSVVNELNKVDAIFMFVKLGLLFVGAIAVLIAAIGIYNTMTMAVTERTQDIGIMKAIGASPSSIRSIFLLESSFIGVVGTLIGTLVAFLVSYAANKIIPVILSSQNEYKEEAFNFVFSYIPFTLIWVSAAISIGIAILSGMRPARRATEIDVLQALRRDI
ncbi:ABC transporter permease [Paenibacillus sp. FJAT-27812]|uniref:ABC transporter permease n=1 Tax=Paenibacillus sp. FJAT-27812 TaxID=1684143 RepID=UPI0006A7BC6E|nr:FtsX-like permease family protein [Paenibacillus sp. FJAT-27812]